MIGQRATLTTGEEVTITGYVRWGTPTYPNKIILRYIIVKFDDEDREDELWEPKYVKVHEMRSLS